MLFLPRTNLNLPLVFSFQKWEREKKAEISSSLLSLGAYTAPIALTAIIILLMRSDKNNFSNSTSMELEYTYVEEIQLFY